MVVRLWKILLVYYTWKQITLLQSYQLKYYHTPTINRKALITCPLSQYIFYRCKSKNVIRPRSSYRGYISIWEGPISKTWGPTSKLTVLKIVICVHFSLESWLKFIFQMFAFQSCITHFLVHNLLSIVTLHLGSEHFHASLMLTGVLFYSCS